LNGDSDNDGLSDYDEVKIYHSDPVNPDTNGNGISDGEEVKLSGGSVLPENMHFADLKTINATEYTGVVGFWSPQDTAMRCIQRRGKLSYKVDFPASGIYKFDFLVGGINKNGTRSKVNFKLDGVEIHSITSPDSIIEKNVSVYTHYLLTGEHIITLEWDNNLPGQEFLLRQIKIGQLNNTADNSSPSTVSKTISEQIVANRNIVKNGARYRVSPASIIGESRYPELVRFNNQSVHKIGENLWYADLELNANAPIEYQLSCENIIFSDNSSAIWTPTNPALENGKKLNLRQGDSLLFTVVDGEAESWVITVNEEVINGTGSEKVPYKFEQRGIYHLIAKTFDGNGVNKKIYSMEIEVSDYKFKQDDMVCWVGYAREWLIPFLPDYIDYKRDLRYTSAVLYPGTNEAVVKTFIDSNKVRYNYAVLKNDEEPLIADVQKISGVG
ncbi:MAG: thrombospondin type 3 repeat-containing protein, partial [Victivallaceae bacterium]